MIWTGAGVHGTFLACLIVMFVFGIDPDESGITFFLVLAPILIVLGILLGNVSYKLQTKWSNENEQGWGYSLNRICTFLKCDFSQPPTIFFIPMPLLSIVSILISLVIWSGIFK